MTTERERRTTGAWLFVGHVAVVVESRTLATLISNNNARQSNPSLEFISETVKLYACINQAVYAFRSTSTTVTTRSSATPSDRAMRLVSSNLANYHATVQKLFIQVLTKPMV